MAATTTSALLFTLLAVLLFSSTQGLNTLSCDAADQGSTLKLFHANSPCSTLGSKRSLSWLDSVLQMQSNDKARLQYLSSLAAGQNNAPIASVQNNYIVKAKIGTPPQTLLLAFDTTNDAAFVSCRGCVGCPRVRTGKSSTLKRLPCSAPQCSHVPGPFCHGRICWSTLKLGDSTVVDAELVQDNIALATDTITNYTFGCALEVSGNSFPVNGLLGLGRGSLSLLSQTSSLYQYTFSYCLPSFKSLNFTGSLKLGPKNQPKLTKTTPLLSNSHRPSLHFVRLLAIAVGTKVLKIPRGDLAETAIDTGTVFTTLVKSTYMTVRDEVRRLMRRWAVSALGGLDTCYKVPINVTTITFMFSGMNVTLPPENFIIKSTAGPTNCLAMSAAPEGNINSATNIIASFQQQNLRVLINANSLGIVHEQCR